jgi:NAD(P) transhydrogenase subunit alpha
MKIGIPKQQQPGETRVALTPGVAGKLISAGHSVVVQSTAGTHAHCSDQQYHDAGASTVSSDEAAPAGIWSDCDVVLTVNPPSADQVGAMQQGAVLIGLLDPVGQAQLMQQCADQGVTAFSMEFLPRITRAQAMDVLSSQANLGGYKATLLGADAAPKIFPMMTTAAGTIRPAKALVVGAGVAGLQAIATARRLGALVEAYDVRPATKEQVQSLGARFIELGDGESDSETAGGYAKQQSEEEQKRQAEQMAKHVIGADVIITTAAVFGKAPPLIIPQDVVDRMHPGTVIVDMAADENAGRGNCEATRPGETYTTENGVTIIGTRELPTLLPIHASEVFANNMQAFLKAITGDEAALAINLDDEVQAGSAITHQGQIVNDTVKEAAAQ